MEALSTIASIAAVFDIFLGIEKILEELCAGSQKDDQRIINQVITELDQLRDVLPRLRDHFEQLTWDTDNTAILQLSKLVPLINELFSSVQNLHTHSKEHLNFIQKRSRWTRRSAILPPTLLDSFERARHLCRGLRQAIEPQGIQCKQLIQENPQTESEGPLAPGFIGGDDESVADVLTWLEPGNTYSQPLEHRLENIIYPATSWLFEHADFKSWLSSPRRTIWLNGPREFIYPIV